MRSITYKRIAEICGLVPLATGTIIFILWLFTRADIFILLGVYTLLAGVVLVLIGAAFLLAYYISAKPKPRALIRPLFWLLINFPVAFLFAIYALKAITTYTVVVNSECPKPAELQIIDPYGQHFTIPQNTTRHPDIDGEGSVIYSLIVEGVTVEEGILIGYTRHNSGIHTTVTISQSCTITDIQLSR